MKAIMIMFDSLNRHMLPPYGCDWTHAPNFQRLAERSITFETAYICSMPCMPARRDMHTGRPNFLHCPWGPLEPFDDSVPEMLKNQGVYTHLISDHYHYWEENGHNYNTKYHTWEFFRGQEGDPWIGQVAEPPTPVHMNGKGRRQDWVNRLYMQREEDQPGTQTFQAGLEFIQRNQQADNWFLQIECFDPHEPFFSHRKYHDLYPEDYDGPLFDWPPYAQISSQTPAQIEHLRKRYAALLSACDARLGDILDTMEAYNLWEDTMLILWTDHGFMLGEHNCLAKNYQPWFEELAHTPFFVWDPRCGKRGERRQALVQPALDLGPTLLEYFGLQPTSTMLGQSLRRTVEDDTPIREAGLFGNFGRHVNVTDGRYVYMRAPARADNQPLNAYTLQTVRLRGRGEGSDLSLAEPFSFSKGLPLFKIPQPAQGNQTAEWGTLLFDLAEDPHQEHPLDDPALEGRMIEHLVRLMKECEAPVEQYERLGLVT